MYCLEKSCFCALQGDGLLSPSSTGVAGAGVSQVRSRSRADLRPGPSEDKACPGRARLAATRALLAPGSCRSSGEKPGSKSRAMLGCCPLRARLLGFFLLLFCKFGLKIWCVWPYGGFGAG